MEQDISGQKATFTVDNAERLLGTTNIEKAGDWCVDRDSSATATRRGTRFVLVREHGENTDHDVNQEPEGNGQDLESGLL